METARKEMEQLLEQLPLEEEMRARCLGLQQAGNYPELYCLLRGARCGFLEQLHESQQRLEQLDYLIYQAKKECGCCTQDAKGEEQ